MMGRFVGRGLDPSAGVCGRQGACPPPRGRGRACPARGFSRGWAAIGCFRGVGDAAPYVGGCPLTGCRANLRRGAGTPPYGCNSRKRGRGRACPARRFPREWAVMGDFRGVGDAAPYVGGCPLTGGYANLRRGVGTPPYGCNSRKRCRGGHSLMGWFVGRGLDPSAGVCGQQGACPPPRGRGRACPARGFSRGWAVTGGFRGVGDAAPYVGGCTLTGSCANLRRDAVRRLLFFFQHWAGHTVENVSSLPGMDV